MCRINSCVFSRDLSNSKSRTARGEGVIAHDLRIGVVFFGGRGKATYGCPREERRVGHVGSWGVGEGGNPCCGDWRNSLANAPDTFITPPTAGGAGGIVDLGCISLGRARPFSSVLKRQPSGVNLRHAIDGLQPTVDWKLDIITNSSPRSIRGLLMLPAAAHFARRGLLFF